MKIKEENHYAKRSIEYFGNVDLLFNQMNCLILNDDM